MNQKLKLLGLGSLILTLLSAGESAFACSCAKAPTPRKAYEQAEAVFIGTPKEVSGIELHPCLREITRFESRRLRDFLTEAMKKRSRLPIADARQLSFG